VLPDLVWLSTPGENEELRYSMRSLTANLPHGKVWLVTERAPSWYTGGAIHAGQDTGNRFINVQQSIRAACDDARISDPFILCDDDEYLMASSPELRPTHKGRLDDFRSAPPYDTRAHDTAKILKARGIREPLSYDRHMPLLVHKSHMLDALEIAKHEAPDTWVLSLYGNLARLGGTYAHDPKCYGTHSTRIEREPGQEHQGDWLSTDEQSWQGAAGALIRALFPTPSEVENPRAQDVRPYVLSVNAGADTGGVSWGMAEAFRDDPTINLRSAVLHQNYIKYPHDLDLGARFYPDVYDHWQRAAVVHIHNNRRTYDHFVNRGNQPDRPFVMYHHGTEYREHIDERNAEVANHEPGARAVVSTIDMLGYGPDLMWAPATYRLGELAKYRNPQRGRRLRVGHAPTDRAIKSTEAFLKACKKLGVVPVLIENADWITTQQAKGTVDLFYDQVLLGYGCNAIEAWAMGIPVIAGGPDRTLTMMRNVFGGKLPFYEATEASIGDAIQALMDPDVRDEYAARGLDHVRRFHSGSYTRAILTPIYLGLAAKNAKPEPAKPARVSRPPEREPQHGTGNLDLVWLVRPGPNEELRYSIRSVTKNLPYRNVVVIGHPPEWYTGSTIYPPQRTASKEANGKAATRVACLTDTISDPFVLMNDDYFLLDPQDAVAITHRGPLSKCAATLSPTRQQAATATQRILAAKGIPDPLLYETHTPLIVTKAAMIRALDLCDGNPKAFDRTIYANLAHVGGVPGCDAKVRHETSDMPHPWASSEDGTFADGIGRELAQLFPNPSAYEA
jgi:hypothetical protein